MRADVSAVRKQVFGFLLASTLGFAVPFSRAQAPSQKWHEDNNWQAVCQAALTAPLPPEAARLQSEAEQGKLPIKPDCDEHALYYGIGQPPAYANALACAYTHRALKHRQFLNGAGTLAMLYANGDGVPRNYDLAIRFACEAADEGGQNNEERFGVLEALRDGKLPIGTRFDLCDEQGSGAMGAYCEGVTQDIADAKRAREMASLMSRLPQAAQVKLPAIAKAETAFEHARERGEYTGGGASGSAGFVELDQGQLREQFVTNLLRFASGDLPVAGATERARAERQMLAAESRAVDAAPSPGQPNMNLGARDPDKGSLAAVQQSWRALFAAWMGFVPLAYPNLAPDRAATELLRLRIHQLRKLAPAS